MNPEIFEIVSHTLFSLACKPECLSVGLGLCTTHIGDDNTRQTCCNYLMQHEHDTESRVCAQNCPPPYFVNTGSTGECIERSKSIGIHTHIRQPMGVL
jgi:hypothetical protein